MNFESIWYLKGNDVYLPRPNSKWNGIVTRMNIMLLKIKDNGYECVKPKAIVQGFNDLELYDGSKIILNSDYIVKVEWGDLLKVRFDNKELLLIVPEGVKINLIDEQKLLKTYAIRVI